MKSARAQRGSGAAAPPPTRATDTPGEVAGATQGKGDHTRRAQTRDPWTTCLRHIGDVQGIDTNGGWPPAGKDTARDEPMRHQDVKLSHASDKGIKHAQRSEEACSSGFQRMRLKAFWSTRSIQDTWASPVRDPICIWRVVGSRGCQNRYGPS